MIDLDAFTSEEMEIVLGCLLHTLHEIDDVTMSGLGDRPDILLKEIDAAINGAPASSFVSKIPERDRKPIWASMWAAIADIHAPQDQLAEADWARLEAWFSQLEVALGHAEPTASAAPAV
ncbi:hypothetical protein [Bosea sp. RAC05]|uniref:hypothetical protein n=1 Tax=Bosea sp. RAC05 TaxID=1842539 RepID=UPI0012374564|nr:hypothetical protein [Bosea sp. RAC05]